MQLFGHLANLLAFDGEEPKQSAPNPLVPETSPELPGLPDAVPSPLGTPAFAAGTLVRDILSGREGEVVQGPEGDFGDVVFVKFGDQTNPIRQDQLELAALVVAPMPAPMPEVALENPEADDDKKEKKEEKKEEKPVKASLEVKAEEKESFEVVDGDTSSVASDLDLVTSYFDDVNKWNVFENGEIVNSLSPSDGQDLLDSLEISGENDYILVRELTENSIVLYLVSSDGESERKLVVAPADLPSDEVDMGSEMILEEDEASEKVGSKKRGDEDEADDEAEEAAAPEVGAGDIGEEIPELPEGAELSPEEQAEAASAAMEKLEDEKKAEEKEKEEKEKEEEGVEAAKNLVAHLVEALKASEQPTYSDVMRALNSIPAEWDSICASVEAAGVKLHAAEVPTSLEGLSAFEQKVVLLASGKKLAEIEAAEEMGNATYTWFGDHGPSVTMTMEDAESCSHPGPCDADVLALSKRPDIASQLAAWKPEEVKAELAEYGAWDDEALADHNENIQRLLWIASGNIRDNSDVYADQPEVEASQKVEADKPSVPMPTEDPGAGMTWAWDESGKKWYKTTRTGTGGGAMAAAKDEKPGLWENIRRKRARGEQPAKPGEKGYPSKKTWKKLTSTQVRANEEECLECPACGGPGVPLGSLGRLEWFRCRNCGMQFSHSTAAKVEAAEMPTDAPEYAEGEMMLRDAGAIKKHVDELEALITPETKAEPFLVTKLNEAKKALSMVTDFLNPGIETPKVEAELKPKMSESKDETDYAKSGPIPAIKHKKPKKPTKMWPKLDKEFRDGKSEVTNDNEVDLSKSAK